MKDNFEKCLPYTLRYEGGYSNDVGDPGGKTMRGVTWRRYNEYRRDKGLARRPVRECTMDETRDIYRRYYWDAVNGDALPAGPDFAVFDGGVNSGPARGRQWLAQAIRQTDGSPVTVARAVCDIRLAYDMRLTRLWRRFGRGWKARINDVRARAVEMAAAAPQPQDLNLRVGSIGLRVKALQTALRAKGYPAGNIDGIFGAQTRRAVILFQLEIKSPHEQGVWRPEYDAALAKAPALNPGRASATEADLKAQGDKTIKALGWLKTFGSWLGVGGAAGHAATTTETGSSILAYGHEVLQPLATIMATTAANKWLLLSAGGVSLFIFARYVVYRRLIEYRHFDFQGGFGK
jgi:lysozyme family protein